MSSELIKKYSVIIENHLFLLYVYDRKSFFPNRRKRLPKNRVLSNQGYIRASFGKLKRLNYFKKKTFKKLPCFIKEKQNLLTT